MDFRELFKKQLQENQDLKSQIDCLETILRSFIPFVERKDDIKLIDKLLSKN